MTAKSRLYRGKQCIALVLSLLFLCSLFPTTTTAETGKNVTTIPSDSHTSLIEYTYIFDIPQVKTREGTRYLTIDSLQTTEQPGEPVIPVHDVRVLLPADTTIDHIEVQTGELKTLEGAYTLAHGQEPVPVSYTGQIQQTPPNPDIYNSVTPYPNAFYKQLMIQQLRGYSILFLNLYPAQYIPKTGCVEYVTTMTVKIYTKEDQDNKNDDSLYRGLSKDEDLLFEKSITVDALSTYHELPSHQSLARGYDLLIITTESLKQGFIPLVDYHNKNDFKTKIKLLGRDIPVSSSYNQTCTNIRDFIRNEFKYNSIEYVLIGGDIDVIPAIYLMGDYPADMYYACLDGTFNYNNDSYWGACIDGENGGEVDFMAEVYVGRACVGNLSEVDIFVNKTLTYLRLKHSTDYLNTFFMVGEHLGNNSWGGMYLDRLIDGNTYYGTVGIPSDQYSIVKLDDRDWELYGWPQPWMGSGGWPNTLLANQINNGTYVVNHLGHSGSFYNMKLDIYWNMTDIEKITNKDLCFIYSQGCHAGGFDLDSSPWRPDCIAEYFTVKRPYGAFAGVWYNREGWIGPSNWFHAQFWDAVFGENISVISQANQDSKEDNLYRLYDLLSLVRHCCYEINYFGDPTLSFFNRPYTANAHGPYQGLANQPIYFRGSVYNASYPCTWYWDFGDGNSSREKNPVHRYLRTGEYVVRLTVTDSNGQNVTDETTATIDFQVNAYGPYFEVIYQPLQLNGSVVGGLAPYTWSWSFGDGNHSFEQNPVHIYNDTGTFTVTLIVTDHYGNRANDSTTAWIAPTTVWVDDDNMMPPWDGTPENPYPFIWMGIDAVVDGGTVYVCPGLYIEDVFIYKPVNLIGLEKESTLITRGDYRDMGDVLSIWFTNWVNISGFTIQGNALTANGVNIYCSQHVCLQDLVIEPSLPWYEPVCGVNILSSSDSTILQTRIEGYGSGIHMEDGARNTIRENTITGNTWGISLLSSFGNHIFNNNFIDNLCYPIDSGVNQWDNGFNSGGNYWDDFDEPSEGAYDLFQGEDQTIPGPDWIIDLGLPSGGLNPYTHIGGGGQNKDWYPVTIPDAWYGW